MGAAGAGTAHHVAIASAAQADEQIDTAGAEDGDAIGRTRSRQRNGVARK